MAKDQLNQCEMVFEGEYVIEFSDVPSFLQDFEHKETEETKSEDNFKQKLSDDDTCNCFHTVFLCIALFLLLNCCSVFIIIYSLV